MAGDYTKFQRHYGALVADLNFSPLQPLTQTAFTVRNASYQIFIQKIAFYPAIYAAATLTIQDTATPNLVIATVSIPATAPSTGSLTPLDWGPTGIALTIGCSLQLVVSAGTPTVQVHIEGYQRLAQTISALSGASAQ